MMGERTRTSRILWGLTLCAGVLLSMLVGGAIAAAGAGTEADKAAVAPKKTPLKPANLSKWEVTRGNPALKQVALTFDDGPHPEATPELLGILERANVMATFFLVGMKAAAAPDLVRAMKDAGHCLGNHTYHHPRLPQISLARVEQEVRLCGETLKAITGETPRYFRPPGGQYDVEVLKVIAARGYKTIMWSYSPGDIKRISPDRLYNKIVANTHNGSIILLHDGLPETYAMLPRLITTLQAKGYTFVTIDEMLRGDTAGVKRDKLKVDDVEKTAAPQ
jgi:peptidoglycan/xylan/chitin deacetylase (PgdA/CDA1 family)